MMTIDAIGRLCVPTIILAAALAVSACGLKGDLYLPEPETASPPLQEPNPSGSESGDPTGDPTDDEASAPTKDRQN